MAPMPGARLATVLSAVAVGAVLTGASRAAAPPDRVPDAFLAADEGELARAGRQASSRELAPRLAGADRLSALAAASAAPSADDPWQLLAPLARLAGGADRPLAVAAATSAAR